MSATKDLVRELNNALNEAETQGTREVYWGFQEQREALFSHNFKSLATKTIPKQLIAQIATVITLNSDRLYEAIYTLTLTSVIAGVTQSRFSIPITQSIDVDWRLVNEDARAFAKTYAYDLIKDINQTTIKGISSAIDQYIKGGGSFDDLMDSIRPLLKTEASTARIEAIFHVDRAEMVSVTEVTRAYAEGKINGYMASGLAHKRPSVAPPAHPRCRCDVRPEEKDDGSWVWIWLTANDDLVCPICSPYITNPEVGIARNAPKSEKAIDLLYALEYRLAHSSKFEVWSHLLNAKGLTHTKAIGNVGYVEGKANGGLVIYNRVFNPFKHVEGLGWGDLVMLHWEGIRELRVIGRDHSGAPLRHVLVAEPAFYEIRPSEINRLFNHSVATVGNHHRQDILTGKTAVTEANRSLSHDVFTTLAAALGGCLTYTREVF